MSETSPEKNRAPIDGGAMRPADDVRNQPPPLLDTDLLKTDVALAEALEREEGGWAAAQVGELARIAGSAGVIEAGFLADRNPPELKAFDRYGHRIDRVEFHPAYHDLMRISMQHGLHAMPWRDAKPGAHAARAAMFYCMSQAEAAHGCPISMTYSAVPALRSQPDLAAVWEPKLTGLDYDPELKPIAEKSAATCGMAMTEKQGGSDVRANITFAVPVNGAGPGKAYEITGHKWFCSAPMCDVFLVLAQTEAGLGCFLMPRIRPDGSLNRIQINRLKDKLGNRANASSEVEFHGAFAWLVGDEGRGVKTIIRMVGHTRLDCVIGAAATQRQAVVQAMHHAQYRTAFGKALIDQPLMRNVLADLAIEQEAATQTAMRLAGAFDRAQADAGAESFARLAVAVSKYWVCKRNPALVAEALECLGGAGYVEESVLPRLYREAPLNGVWEGSGNVICLDVLRAIAREPESLSLFMAELEEAKSMDARFDDALAALQEMLVAGGDKEALARIIVERMALLFQASLLLRFSTEALAEAFVATRLDEAAVHRGFGTLPREVDMAAILSRAWG